jgi:peptidyl-prolyl cis-trans isomerase D
MGLMTSMREKMHVVLWGLLAMFILSMTIGGLVGGANILDQLIGRVDPQTTIAKINDINVSPDRYNNLVNQQIDNARSSGQPINDFILQRARNTAWDNLIQDVLVTQEVERLGLSATDQEVIFHLENNPPLFLQQNPSFQSNNSFDINKYRQALANPQGNEWAPIESFMKTTYIPNYKLQKI